ncbi:STAS domain-containing protein [Aquimarina sp. SS2-1]|uniref:STAS domain-containing protein n=1 Tax=Aquimarina besae TaxID=3342247 RepID=UPI00366B2023
MALKITNKQGVYELVGNLQGKNALSLQHHFEQLMTSTEKVILSLDKVSSIDTYGIHVLNKLYRTAIKDNKIFYLIGSENNKIKTAFGNVSYMLRNDFL